MEEETLPKKAAPTKKSLPSSKVAIEKPIKKPKTISPPPVVSESLDVREKPVKKEKIIPAPAVTTPPAPTTTTPTPVAENNDEQNKAHQQERRDKRRPQQRHPNQRREKKHLPRDEPYVEETPMEEHEIKNITKIADLQRMNIAQLSTYAKSIGLSNVASLTRPQMVFEVVKMLSHKPGELLVAEGTLEVLPDGFGFLRSPNYNYLSSPEDIYVSPAQIRRFDLKKGDTVYGQIRSPKEKEKYFALLKVDTINDKTPEQSKERILFENLTPLHPDSRILMETDKTRFSTRILDLVSPIGKGQRAILVAPPKSGKTVLLQHIAHAISINHPEISLMVLNIDERPEEVTELIRTVKGEVISSTFDEPPERHVQVAEMVIEKAKRLVENGKDVVILLDSLTRLARAYNTVQPHSGKILTGGVDANSLHKPKRFFGAARNIDGGGSLTIIASALIDTGSKMDEVIYEEFKGTGNMELVLDRSLAERRIFPAIHVTKSGTRKEELLCHPSELEKIYSLRQALADLTPVDAMKLLKKRLGNFPNNVGFLLSLKD